MGGWHDAIPFDDLHKAKVDGGLDSARPSTPEGFGDVYWAPDGNSGDGALYFTNAAGTAWMEFVAGGGTPTVAMDDLTDVNLVGLTTGQSIYWNGSSWVPQSFARFLDDLLDVSMGTPANGQVLTYNGSTWENQDAAGAQYLYELLDVDLTSPLPEKGSVLAFSDIDGWKAVPAGTDGQVLITDMAEDTGVKFGDSTGVDATARTMAEEALLMAILGW